MSEVAGRMSIQAGARCLEWKRAAAAIARTACRAFRRRRVGGAGGGWSAPMPRAWPWGWRRMSRVIDVSLPRLYELDLQFARMLNTIYSTIDTIRGACAGPDLVIGAVLVPGAAAQDSSAKRW